MSSPFIYEDPLEPPEVLADRIGELALLRDRVAETRNSRLEGPRRYGKTSLLKAALAVADRDGFVPIYVNFLGVLTPADVAERIERAYREQQEKLVEAAKDATRLARVRYQGGSTSYLEVLTTDSNLFAAQLNLVTAQQGEALTLVQLYGALGGCWQS